MTEVMPATRSAPPDAPEPSWWRRNLRWILAAVALLLVLIAVGVAAILITLGSNARYTEALAEHTRALEAARSAVDDLDEAKADAAASTELAGSLRALPAGYVDAAAASALATAADALAADLETAVPPEVDDSARPAERPTWFADLDAAAERLDAQAADLSAAAESAETAAAALDAGSDATDAAGDAFLDAVPAVADAIDAANVSARNLDRIAFRDAVDAVEGSRFSSVGVTAATAYADAASALEASHQAEEAEKAGALYDRRKEVEAFARSIAGGVLLEFDWAPVVNGYGGPNSAGGTATWNTADGGYSTIALSNSVAELWDDPAVVALVAHEVGHAITSKCYFDVYAPETREENEAWATAWALGLGYTGGGSGVELYGYPGEELIELSKSCR